MVFLGKKCYFKFLTVLLQKPYLQHAYCWRFTMIIKATFQRLRQFLFALSLLLVCVSIGVIGFMVVEKHTFTDALYMTMIVISTTGMNEVRQLSAEGKIFVVFLIIFNITTFGYFVSILTKYIFEGELKDVFQHYMTNRIATKMKDHAIVCGCGKNGSKACEELYRSGLPFAIVDRERERIPHYFHNKSSIFIVEGDATQDEVLIEAGIRKAKTIITALPEDAENVFVTLTAKELNPAITIISRASNERSIHKLRRAGAHHVVMPDAIGGSHMASLVTRPEVVEFLGILNGVGHTELKLEEMRVADMKPKFKNKTIRELDIRNLTGVNIIGYKDADGFVFNPTPETELCDGDVVIVLGTENDIRTFVSYCSNL
jgi:voltage-gated potassium channel